TPLTALDRSARRGARRLDVAWPLRFQTRGVFERALVAVRVARRGIAHAASHGWGGGTPLAVRSRAVDRLRAARGADPNRRRHGSCRCGHRNTKRDLP